MKQNIVTLKSIAKGINNDWEFIDWFEWPPNIFALISLVLQRTGAYRMCLDIKYSENWNSKIEEAASVWKNATNNRLMSQEQNNRHEINKDVFVFYNTESILHNSFILLEKSYNSFDLNSLRTISEDKKDSDNLVSLEIAKALITILVITDECCCGIGLPGQKETGENIMLNLFRGVANQLLTVTGSLCTFAKFHGVVTPKMRTPQSGIVIRSLTHHLTYHSTEVEVVWRTFPWLNHNKQSLNLMVVPYPFKISKTDFEILDNNFETRKYFKGVINNSLNYNFFDGIVKKLIQYSDENNVVDLLIFPEMSLTEDQYRTLLFILSNDRKKFKDGQLPIIVAGVLHAEQDSSHRQLPIHNEARIATFFNDKWYDITQRKHHRWQLDRNQILQYGLEGYFPSGSNWTEYCSILQRRLTILAPNNWLAMTALICEDLVRQEPVSEVIRGIGPTLLFALLSDGPQLVNRWSARYASVLADDPGTAVLSITSKGMVGRSRIPKSDQYKNDDTKYAIGLWKDMIRGWNELHLNGDAHALMFTISTKMEEEYTLDGRGDGAASSVFKMDSYIPKQVVIEYDENDKKSTSSNLMKNLIGFGDTMGNWHDIRILSATYFAIDVIIDLILMPNSKNEHQYTTDKHVETIINTLIGELAEADSKLISSIKTNISSSWKAPNEIGTSTISNPEDITSNLEKEIKAIRLIIEDFKKANKEQISLVALKDICKKISSKNQKEFLIEKKAAIMFLFNIYSKLSGCKTTSQLKTHFNEDSQLTQAVALAMKREIKEIINQ